MSKKIGKNETVSGSFPQPISMMEPMLPEESVDELNDLVMDFIEKSHRLSGQIHPVLHLSISHLTRSMNCYYSNFIEGHNTHPRDIEKALNQDFSTQPEKRALQLEAKAHIEVQKKIDESEDEKEVLSEDFICWLHREFCKNLPEESLWIENPDTKRKVRMLPGALRQEMVVVGRHIPPSPENIPAFLRRFTEAYCSNHLTKLRKVLAVAASHHRLLWIHPFLDGNGRVARLLSHAYFKKIGLGNGLWSVSRGLARTVDNYRLRLAGADAKRSGDLDGRGSLSARGLIEFCRYFLKTCVDQVEYMELLLKPVEILRRIQIYCSEEESAGRLPKKSFSLLREAWLMGEFSRGQAGSLTNYRQRQASTVLNELIKKGLLLSDTPKGDVRLNFPLYVVERWFPNLYPGA